MGTTAPVKRTTVEPRTAGNPFIRLPEPESDKIRVPATPDKELVPA